MSIKTPKVQDKPHWRQIEDDGPNGVLSSTPVRTFTRASSLNPDQDIMWAYLRGSLRAKLIIDSWRFNPGSVLVIRS